MNVFGHLAIAGSVRKLVDESTGVRLNYAGFLCGNVLPDFSAEVGRTPHFFSESLTFLLGRAQEFQSSGGAGGVSTFSGALEAGIITHYLSDYFCYAHSERCTFGLCRHHLYELLMLTSIRKGRFFYRQQPVHPQITLCSLEPFLTKTLRAYESRERRHARDFYFALEVSTAVVRCLLRESLCSGSTPSALLSPSRHAARTDLSGEICHENRLLL